MDESKKQIEREYLQFIEDANAEELEVLQLIIDGVKKKRNSEAYTFIGGITHMRSKLHDDGSFEMILPNSPLVKNPLGITHGGLTATLLDTTLGSLININLPADKTTVTTELKINYLRPGNGKYLRCVATLLHKGSKIAVLEGKVYDDKDQLIAHGSGSFFIIDRK